MYYENVNRTINVWRDGDVLHVFITAPNQKKYNQFSQTIDYVKGIFRRVFHLRLSHVSYNSSKSLRRGILCVLLGLSCSF